MKKYVAELIGTFTLVLFGCGTAVVAGADTTVGILGIAFAFGFALIGMAYGIGPVSGCHINPAVSIGVFCAGRMNAKDLIGYIVSQFLGAIAASAVLFLIMKGLNSGFDIAVAGLGQNFWSDDPGIGYNMISAMIFEFVATFLFIVVILGSTQEKASPGFAGLAIGITLVVIHIFGIKITGVSVNPARSLGPAIFVGQKAISQIWLFLVFPSVAGIIAGLLFKFKVLEKD